MQPRRGAGNTAGATAATARAVALPQQVVMNRAFLPQHGGSVQGHYPQAQAHEEARPPPSSLSVPLTKPLNQPTDEHRLRLRDNLQAVMFGCGDTIQSDPSAVTVLEQAVLQFTRALIYASMADNLSKVMVHREAALEAALQADDNAAAAAQAGDATAAEDAYASAETARRTLPPRLSHANVLAALALNDGNDDSDDPCALANASRRQAIHRFAASTVETNQRLRKRLTFSLGGPHETFSCQAMSMASPQLTALSGGMKEGAWHKRRADIIGREEKDKISLWQMMPHGGLGCTGLPAGITNVGAAPIPVMPVSIAGATNLSRNPSPPPPVVLPPLPPMPMASSQQQQQATALQQQLLHLHQLQQLQQQQQRSALLAQQQQQQAAAGVGTGSAQAQMLAAAAAAAAAAGVGVGVGIAALQQQQRAPR